VVRENPSTERKKFTYKIRRPKKKKSNAGRPKGRTQTKLVATCEAPPTVKDGDYTEVVEHWHDLNKRALKPNQSVVINPAPTTQSVVVIAASDAVTSTPGSPEPERALKRRKMQ